MWLWLFACGGSSLPPSVPPYDRDTDGVLAPADCDDTNAAIYPGANDPPYDGVDGNCDGSDDFDVDGDGEQWVAHGGTDCDDNNPDVNSAATEIPYDGLDNDCDRSTSDGDLDGDGSSFPADCDDADPNRYPGAPEAIGDLIDGDCGGDGDSTSTRLWPGEYTRPHSLRLTDFEGGPALLVAADSLAATEPDALPQLGVGIAWIHADLPDPELLFFRGSTQTDPDHFDAIDAVDAHGIGDTLWLGTSTRSWVSDTPALTLEPYLRFGGSMVRQNGPSRLIDDQGPAEMVDVFVDGGGLPWLAAAFDGGLSWLTGTGIGKGLGGTADVPATSAAIVDDQLWSCGLEGCEAFTLPADGPVTTSTPLPGPRRVFRQHDGFFVVKTANGAQLIGPLTIDLFPGEDVVDLDAVIAEGPNGQRVAAVGAISRDGTNELLLTFGDVDQGSLNIATLSLPPELHPESVAIWTDDSRVFVAAALWNRIGIDFSDRIVVAELPWAD
jgi:hypothetical protein